MAIANALATSGCVAVMEMIPEPSTEGLLYLTAAPAAERNIVSKSYMVGQSYTASVGEPMVSVKSYRVAERVARAISLRDFEQYCPSVIGTSGPCGNDRLASIRGNLGDSYEVHGAIVDGGTLYYLIATSTDDDEEVYVMADADGYLRPGDYAAWRSTDDVRRSSRGTPLDPIEIEERIEAGGALFSYETEQLLVPGAANYLNYELVYAGIGEDSRGTVYKVVYREYRRDGSRTPSYEQPLVFLATQASFDIFGMRVAVDSAATDSITFTVAEDTLGNAG